MIMATLEQAELLAGIARSVVLAHRRRSWANVAKGVWLRADKVATYRRINHPT